MEKEEKEKQSEYGRKKKKVLMEHKLNKAYASIRIPGNRDWLIGVRALLRVRKL